MAFGRIIEGATLIGFSYKKMYGCFAWTKKVALVCITFGFKPLTNSIINLFFRFIRVTLEFNVMKINHS